MNLYALLKTTIAQKILVALTGLFMIFFIVAHLLGNLEIFSGPDAINQYGVLLRTFPKVLWSFRILLIIAIAIHVIVTISLSKKNKLAKEISYQNPNFKATTFASKTMLLGGITVLCFVIYHIAHFTLHVTNPEFEGLIDSHGRHHVYNMVILGFSNPLVSSFYILAQIMLAFHISHGFSSCFRTLGLANHCLFNKIKLLGRVIAIIIATLYISIPVSVLLGFITLSN